MYKCFSCRKDVSLAEVKKRVHCPYCGYRILVKLKAPTLTAHVKAE